MSASWPNRACERAHLVDHAARDIANAQVETPLMSWVLPEGVPSCCGPAIQASELISEELRCGDERGRKRARGLWVRTLKPETQQDPRDMV